jgi:putative GTP pyrophosphokinase
MLDDYRRSFGPAYEVVVRTVREMIAIQPTGRPAKSTGAIVEKLHRETIRLSQIQDIAGCRIVVADVPEQDRMVGVLRAGFSKAVVIDRRSSPSYGYRAVHVVVEALGRSVEIQIRTTLQHTWAEVSEKLSDVVDPAIKYGGGPDQVKEALKNGSDAVNLVEGALKQVAEAREKALADRELPEEARKVLSQAEDSLADIRKQLDEALRTSVSLWVDRASERGEDQ